MVSFYKPSKTRNKILIEENAFSSDRYVVNSQLKYHGLDESSLITVSPEKDHLIDEDKIISKINSNKESLSLVLIPGENLIISLTSSTRVYHQKYETCRNG